jgi:hypothetical protein
MSDIDTFYTPERSSLGSNTDRQYEGLDFQSPDIEGNKPAVQGVLVDETGQDPWKNYFFHDLDSLV